MALLFSLNNGYFNKVFIYNQRPEQILRKKD